MNRDTIELWTRVAYFKDPEDNFGRAFQRSHFCITIASFETSLMSLFQNYPR